MKVTSKLAGAGLAVITGALLVGAGLARQFPNVATHAGYILGAGSLAIGVIGLLASVPHLIRRNP